MDGIHDLGGMQGFGRVNTPGSGRTHDEPWEVRAQFVGLLSKTSGGSMRRRIEALDPAEYLASSYYARWLAAAERTHLGAGVLSTDDLDRWYRHFEADPDATVPRRDDPPLAARVTARLTAGQPLPEAAAPAFRAGQAVVVKRMHPTWHHRCPRYVRGAPGTIAFVCGQDRVPGDDATNDAVAAVYTVRFSSIDLWGRIDETPFTVLVDLWENYLEAAP